MLCESQRGLSGPVSLGRNSRGNGEGKGRATQSPWEKSHRSCSHIQVPGVDVLKLATARREERTEG